VHNITRATVKCTTALAHFFPPSLLDLEEKHDHHACNFVHGGLGVCKCVIATPSYGAAVAAQGEMALLYAVHGVIRSLHTAIWSVM
jgi:hypothetical protein